MAAITKQTVQMEYNNIMEENGDRLENLLIEIASEYGDTNVNMKFFIKKVTEDEYNTARILLGPNGTNNSIARAIANQRLRRAAQMYPHVPENKDIKRKRNSNSSSSSRSKSKTDKRRSSHLK